MSYDPKVAPTNAEVQAAWRKLFQLDVPAIGDMSMPELNRILNESGPELARERQLVRALVVLRAELDRAEFEAKASSVLLDMANKSKATHLAEIQRLDLELAKSRHVLEDLRKTYEARR